MGPAALHDLTAVIVTYNSAGTIGELLDSLDAGTVRPRIIVVDNGSSDDTVAVARSRAGITVIDTGANLGYSGGINVGLRVTPASHDVLILNPDLAVTATTVERMRRALDTPGVGIVAPLLLDPNGGVRFDSLRREPSILGALGDAIFGNRWAARPAWFAETLRRDSDYAEPRDVAWAGGAALLIAAACRARVGGWDADTYFLYSEETDYARRARDAGFRVRFDPRAQAHHVGSGSGQPAALVALISVNRVRYFRARHSALATAAFRSAIAVQHLLRLHDARHRHSLRTLLDGRRWSALPAGDRMPPGVAPHTIRTTEPTW